MNARQDQGNGQTDQPQIPEEPNNGEENGQQ